MAEIDGEYITQTQEQRNYGVLRAWFPRWVWNTACNFEMIRDEFLRQKKDLALAKYQNKFKGTPAVIIGSGSSLDSTAPLLKDFQGAVFSSFSNAKICARHGHKPDYICAFDGNVIHEQTLEAVNWKNTTLVTHPAVDPWLFEFWKWDKAYYCMMHIAAVDYSLLKPNMTLDQVVAIIKDQTFGKDFFEDINPIIFPWIRTAILNAGCVVNNAIQVAHFMGYDPLFLCGVDFGYPKKRHRAIGYQPVRWADPVRALAEIALKAGHADWFEWLQDKAWRKVIPGGLESIGRKLHKAENGVLTTEEQIEYKHAMMHVYMIDCPQLMDCSEGIITELPKVEFGKVVKDGEGYWKKYIRTDEEIKSIGQSVIDRQNKLSDERNADQKGTKVPAAAGSKS